MKTKLLTAVLLLLLCGCGGPNDYYVEHFVVGYYDTESIKLYNGFNENDTYDYYKNWGYEIISIWVNNFPDNSIHEYDEGRMVGWEEYLALCNKHGDNGFNRKVPRGISQEYINFDFVTVSIISDADFDEAHPVGAELGDLVMFKSATPIHYIRSGYKGDYLKGAHFYEIYKLASELTAEDLVLIGWGRKRIAFLELFSAPTLAKTHNITVTMTADDGRVFSDTVSVTWE